jgi:hypothetical protein
LLSGTLFYQRLIANDDQSGCKVLSFDPSDYVGANTGRFAAGDRYAGPDLSR